MKNENLARVMVGSTAIAAMIIAVGLIWFLFAHPGASPGDHLFSGEPKYFRNPINMVQKALEWKDVGERRSVIMIGVVLLLLGPPLRVALVGLGYLVAKDKFYALVSFLVLGILLVSFFW